MHKLLLSLVAASLLSAGTTLAADHSDPQATWDLTDLYPSV